MEKNSLERNEIIYGAGGIAAIWGSFRRTLRSKNAKFNPKVAGLREINKAGNETISINGRKEKL